MELPQLWDQPNLILIGVACLVVFFGLSLLISGWSMKLACRICGADEIGFGYGLLIAVASGIAGIAASLAVTLGVSEPSPLLGFLAPLIAMIATIALLVRGNPFRALGIYLLHSIISSLATMVVFVPLVIAAVFLVPTSLKDELAATAAESLKGKLDDTSLMAEWSAFREAETSLESMPDSATPASTVRVPQPVGADAADLSKLESALYKTPTVTPQTTPQSEANPVEKSTPSPEKLMPRAVLPPGVELNPFVK